LPSLILHRKELEQMKPYRLWGMCIAGNNPRPDTCFAMMYPSFQRKPSYGFLHGFLGEKIPWQERLKLCHWLQAAARREGGEPGNRCGEDVLRLEPPSHRTTFLFSHPTINPTASHCTLSSTLFLASASSHTCEILEDPRG
jgi:hypothetical protein